MDERQLSLAPYFVGTGYGDAKESGLNPVAKFWEEAQQKREKGLPWIRIDDDAKNRKKLNLGPGGAAGIGCGAGIGVALVGGAGVGAWPWSALKIVFGVGFGCGIGIGYGFGHGLGYLWDRPPLKNASGKRVVIEI